MNPRLSTRRSPFRIFLLLLTLLAVYVLSSSPVQALYSSRRLQGPMPSDLSTCYRPVAWLQANTPLGKPLTAYDDWCQRVMKQT